MNMNYVGFECPVCGKYSFDDIDSAEMCPHCEWQINLVQYDDHDISEGENILSVNESKLEYNLVNNTLTAEKAQKLKDDFIETRSQIQRKFREDSKHQEYNRPSCEDYHERFVALRVEYIANLEKLKSEVGA